MPFPQNSPVSSSPSQWNNDDFNAILAQLLLSAQLELTEEHINQYIRERSNQNLQVIGFSRETFWNKAAILNGLDTVKAVNQIFKVADFDQRITTEMFLPKVSNNGDIKIEDSFDFTRNDGTKVSIDISRRTVRVYIWSQNQYQDKEKIQKKITMLATGRTGPI
ncbi:hypothetical protein CRE_18341 [Caenorhabditis remanei]|uniref:Uncharacterized protein n=1 Tax=Caenorhabditis remanei TaxID=31234 RepID=E3NRI6_CAERE|nr:hypothetical protein CRE_18341 [Caenorhabditis remanei]